MYVFIGVDVDKQRFKVKIFGRYFFVVGQFMFQYLFFFVVNNSSLEIMFEVLRKYFFIKIVELYLEVKFEGVIGFVVCFSKRQKIVKVERDSSIGNIGDVVVDVEMIDVNNIFGLNVVVQVINLVGDKELNFGVLKLCLFSLWFDDYDLCVGLCFKDVDELKKVVDWCFIKGM